MLLTVSLTLIASLTLLCHSSGASAADTDHVTGDDHAHSRRVLVFGGNGFLGASSVQRLLERKHTVTIVNRGNWYWDVDTRILPHVQSISCDRNNGVHSCAELVSLIDSVGRFDAVVDFSGYNGRAIREATTLLRHKADVYVHISADWVYHVCDPDRRSAGPVREEDAVRPDDKGFRDELSTLHVYGNRKMEAEEELIIQRYDHTDGLPGIPFVILRLPDVLGERDTTYRFWLYQLWVRLAPLLPARPVTIPTFLLDQKNSFVYVEDVAKVVVDAVEAAGADSETFTDQVFNLAWSQQFTLEQFLREVEAALGVEEQQQFHSDDDPVIANVYLYPSVSPHVSTFYLRVTVLRKVL